MIRTRGRAVQPAAGRRGLHLPPHVASNPRKRDEYVLVRLSACTNIVEAQGVLSDVRQQCGGCSVIMYNYVLRHAGTAYNLAGLRWVLEQMKEQGLTPTQHTWTGLMASHRFAGNLRAVLGVYRIMRATGEPVSSEAYAEIITACQVSMQESYNATSMGGREVAIARLAFAQAQADGVAESGRTHLWRRMCSLLVWIGDSKGLAEVRAAMAEAGVPDPTLCPPEEDLRAQALELKRPWKRNDARPFAFSPAANEGEGEGDEDTDDSVCDFMDRVSLPGHQR
eukprot:TRINITY_DN47011_c0_g1_i1.p1 TRINITY_DN47011_c0_g1~~TRINITY_DN47011_c0_g1_i1.p1  ORF type:complete len:301 (+),score=80.12 TRINITY_DN47011_c0_g1_i1:62-904(+)